MKLIFFLRKGRFNDENKETLVGITQMTHETKMCSWNCHKLHGLTHMRISLRHETFQNNFFDEISLICSNGFVVHIFVTIKFNIHQENRS